MQKDSQHTRIATPDTRQADTLIPQEPPSTGPFPWTGRSQREWEHIGISGARFLIHLAADNDHVSDLSDAGFLARWQLQDAAAFLARTSGQQAPSRPAAPTGARGEGEGEGEGEDRHDGDGDRMKASTRVLADSLVPTVTAAFAGKEGHGLLRLLRALKSARAETLRQERERVGARRESHPNHADQSLLTEALLHCHFSSEHETHAVVARYRALQQAVVVLYEDASHKGIRRKWRSLNEDIEDRLGHIAMRLVETVVTFYWEPVVIDPVETTRAFVRTAFSNAYKSSELEVTDTRGLDGLPLNAEHLVAPDSVEQQVLDQEFLDQLTQSLADDPIATQMVHDLLAEGTSKDAIARTLGLSDRQIDPSWQRLKAALAHVLGRNEKEVARTERTRTRTTAGQTPAHAEELAGQESKERPLPVDRQWKQGRGQGSLSPLWEDLKSRADYYQDLVDKWGKLCLLDSQQLIFQTALRLATGERTSTLTAVAEALEGKYSPRHIRRQIAVAADLLTRTSSRSRESGAWLTRRGQWYQEQQTLRRLRQDPSFWDGLKPEMQELIEHYYLEPREKPHQEAVGRQLSKPLSESRVSRRIDTLRKIVTLHQHMQVEYPQNRQSHR